MHDLTQALTVSCLWLVEQAPVVWAHDPEREKEIFELGPVL